MSSPISRRSVAKGTAWAVPAVTVAASAPAMAASTPATTITCPSASSITLQPGSAKPNVSFYAAANQYPGGTVFSLSMGMWNIPPATTSTGQQVTGYYMLPGACGYLTCAPDSATGPTMPGPKFPVWASDGTQYQGNVASYTPTGCSPQTAGAGLQENWQVQTSIPYDTSGTGCFPNPANNLGKIQIPVTIIYLNGTTPIYNTAGQSCCYTLTVDFPSGGCVGSRYATSWSWA